MGKEHLRPGNGEVRSWRDIVRNVRLDFRGGVKGGLECVCFSLGLGFVILAKGDGSLELPEELPVDILLLSVTLSDSSLTEVLGSLDWPVNEEARGLCKRVSEK